MSKTAKLPNRFVSYVCNGKSHQYCTSRCECDCHFNVVTGVFGNDREDEIIEVAYELYCIPSGVLPVGKELTKLVERCIAGSKASNLSAPEIDAMTYSLLEARNNGEWSRRVFLKTYHEQLGNVMPSLF